MKIIPAITAAATRSAPIASKIVEVLFVFLVSVNSLLVSALLMPAELTLLICPLSWLSATVAPLELLTFDELPIELLVDFIILDACNEDILLIVETEFETFATFETELETFATEFELVEALIVLLCMLYDLSL